LGKRAKILGLLLILCAIATIIETFNFWHFWLIGDWNWFWNPIGYYLAPKIVGDVWLIGGIATSAVYLLIDLLYAAVLFVIGAFAVLKS
jgi:hypothetical protein